MCDYDDMGMTCMAQCNARATDTGSECTEPQIVSPTDRTPDA